MKIWNVDEMCRSENLKENEVNVKRATGKRNEERIEEDKMKEK